MDFDLLLQLAMLFCYVPYIVLAYSTFNKHIHKYRAFFPALNMWSLLLISTHCKPIFMLVSLDKIYVKMLHPVILFSLVIARFYQQVVVVYLRLRSGPLIQYSTWYIYNDIRSPLYHNSVHNTLSGPHCKVASIVVVLVVYLILH